MVAVWKPMNAYLSRLTLLVPLYWALGKRAVHRFEGLGKVYALIW